MASGGSLQSYWLGLASRTKWLLCGSLLLLCALASVQYYWINEVIRAERERATSVLHASLTAVQADFDFEITRAIATFSPATRAEEPYAVRYAQWLQRAPYPRLMLGAYTLESGPRGAVLKPISPTESVPATKEWRDDVTQLASTQLSLLGCAGLRVPGRTPLPGTWLGGHEPDLSSNSKLVGQGPWAFKPMTTPASPASFAGVGAGVLISGNAGFPYPQAWGISIAGNPAFAFALAPSPPASISGRATTAGAYPGDDSASACGPGAAKESALASSPQKWGLVVFDPSYLARTLLPELLRRQLPEGLALDYEVRVIDRAVQPGRVVFSSLRPAGQAGPFHADWQLDLLAPRFGCFVPGAGSNARANSPAVKRLDALSLTDLLTRAASSCRAAQASPPLELPGLWTLQIEYRKAPIDRSMATFRRRSVLFSAGALLVLAAGVLSLVLLSERARVLAQMRTEFVLGVSHELRTPLTVLRVAADNLEKGLVVSGEQARDYGQVIGTHARRLSEMIEETLAFARVQSGTAGLDTAPVAVGELIRSALAACMRLLKDAQFEVHTEIASDLPPLDVNAKLIGKCLENLIENAVKYAAPGRWLAIRAHRCGRRENDHVQLSIEDRGPGIGETDLPRIFEPFYRARGGGSVAGLGLGLTFVNRVIQAHRGSIEVSTGNAGTIFSVLLRCAPSAKITEAPRP